MDNNSKIQQAISLSREIQEHLSQDILKEGHPFIVWKENEWIREVFSLLAKQSHLFESSILLLENNMEQEAYILVRSQFNNMLWIAYLCNDNNDLRLKEYYCEPLIGQVWQLKKIKEYVRNLPENTPEFEKFSTLNLAAIDINAERIMDILKAGGYDPNKSQNNKSIFSLTKDDPLLLGLYISFYHEASKFEHADVSTIKNYRIPILDDVSTDIAFTFDLSKSNITLWKFVFKYTLLILYQSINAIYTRITNRDKHLLDNKQFEKKDFNLLTVTIKLATDIIDSIADQEQ